MIFCWTCAGEPQCLATSARGDQAAGDCGGTADRHKPGGRLGYGDKVVAAQLGVCRERDAGEVSGVESTGEQRPAVAESWDEPAGEGDHEVTTGDVAGRVRREGVVLPARGAGNIQKQGASCRKRAVDHVHGPPAVADIEQPEKRHVGQGPRPRHVGGERNAVSRQKSVDFAVNRPAVEVDAGRDGAVTGQTRVGVEREWSSGAHRERAAGELERAAGDRKVGRVKGGNLQQPAVERGAGERASAGKCDCPIGGDRPQVAVRARQVERRTSIHGEARDDRKILPGIERKPRAVSDAEVERAEIQEPVCLQKPSIADGDRERAVSSTRSGHC